jgi:hypothetical protein
MLIARYTAPLIQPIVLHCLNVLAICLMRDIRQLACKTRGKPLYNAVVLSRPVNLQFRDIEDAKDSLSKELRRAQVAQLRAAAGAERPSP